MKYQIIYADPPWSFYNGKSVQPSQNKAGGALIKKIEYPVLSVDAIKAIDVPSISDDKCALFIWTTDHHLPYCFDVISSWGFTYKTVGFAWQKLTKSGKPVCQMAPYTNKSGIELCLLATKGFKASELVKNQKVRALVSSERQEHSKKPDEVRNRIVELCGNLPRIELFARQRSAGWDVWGNEVDSSLDIKKSE
jgi:site-specific DNA-methyltransferase (adenine-specific)